MRFAVLATLIPLAFSAAVSIEKRADNTAAVLSGLKTLESDVTKLDNLVLVNPPNIGSVQTAEQQVETDIKSITTSAQNSDVVTQAESTQIYNEINNNLKPLIFKVLDDLVAKKANFASVKSIVKQDLTNINSLTGTLGNALVAKATGPAKTNAPALIKSIQDKIAAAIAQYS